MSRYYAVIGNVFPREPERGVGDAAGPDLMFSRMYPKRVCAAPPPPEVGGAGSRMADLQGIIGMLNFFLLL